MTDPRHERREELLQELFAQTFLTELPEQGIRPVPSTDCQAIIEELPVIDGELQKVAPERPLHEINKIDLAILRLIVFESKHKKTPRKVLLNEAIELAKTFGSEGSAKFINGALAHLLLEE